MRNRPISCSIVGIAALLLLAQSAICTSARETRAASASATRQRIARAVEKLEKDGLHAKIPPHVSDLLGIATGGNDCPVLQRFERNGTLVRGFDVSVANKDDIVLFVTDEAANEHTYYLTSGEGSLRRVLAVREGVGNVLPVTSKQRTAFQKELQYWLDRISRQ